MADEPKESGAAEVLGKDPKKRKIMAIGIGIAALAVIYLVMKSKGSSAAAPTTAASQGVQQQPIADVTVPSDQQSSSDLLAQWATMMQAANAQKTANTTQPGTPISTAGDPGNNVIGGFWHTFQAGDNPQAIAAHAYDQQPSVPWLMTDVTEIENANPQVNWGGTIAPGTPIYIPPMPWDAAGPAKPALAAGDSWNYPGAATATSS
jgi:hypothetical protein